MVKAGERAYIVEGTRLPEAALASLDAVPYDTASDQWAAGVRRLETAPPDQRPVLERVTRQIQDELRRRLGGPFTTDELVELYDQDTGWTSDLAYAPRPGAAVGVGRARRRRRRVRALPARGHGLRAAGRRLA